MNFKIKTNLIINKVIISFVVCLFSLSAHAAGGGSDSEGESESPCMLAGEITSSSRAGDCEVDEVDEVDAGMCDGMDDVVGICEEEEAVDEVCGGVKRGEIST